MNWKRIEDEKTLDDLKKESSENVVLIFKHSSRCSISAMALDRLVRSWNEQEMSNLTPYFLDLITYRELSNKIAQDFGVEHQSPQVLIIKSGRNVYVASHLAINYQEIHDELNRLDT